MDLLKKLFIFVLFLFPLGEIIRIDFGNGAVIKPLDIGIVVLVLLWLVFKFIQKQKIKQTNILIPVALFVLSGLFSLIISNLHLSLNEFLISFSYMLRWVAYAGVFFVVCDFDKDFKKKISKLLIIVGSIIVVLGYLQYFFYSSLKNLFYSGWDEHMYRMFSVFLDPNFAGAFFVLFFLFLTNLFFKKKNKFIGLLILLTLGAIFLTFSRSALIMLSVSSSLLFILINKKIWIGLLLGITLLVLVISSRYFNVENINLFRIVSTEARIETSRNAIKIIQDHPIFGVGFNAYRYAQLNYGFRQDKAKVVSHADSGADNSILFILATTGIVGFLFYSFLWIRILKNYNVLVVASVIGVLIDSLFVNSLFYTYIMFWLWVIIGLSFSTSSEFKENK